MARHSSLSALDEFIGSKSSPGCCAPPRDGKKEPKNGRLNGCMNDRGLASSESIAFKWKHGGARIRKVGATQDCMQYLSFENGAWWLMLTGSSGLEEEEKGARKYGGSRSNRSSGQAEMYVLQGRRYSQTPCVSPPRISSSRVPKA